MAITIATYNVNGIADPTKRRAVFEFFGTVQAEVILIQKTHSKVVTEHRWQKEWTKLLRKMARTKQTARFSVKRNIDNAVWLQAREPRKLSSQLQFRTARVVCLVFLRQRLFCSGCTT